VLIFQPVFVEENMLKCFIHKVYETQ